MTQDGQMIGPDNERNLTSGDEPTGAGILGQHADVRHVSLLILTLFAVLYTLHLAAPFFLPIVVAILLNLLLSPIVRLLRDHLRIPVPLGAGIVIVVLLSVVGFGAYRLTPAASAWLARAPESMATLKRRIQPLSRPMEKVSQAAEQVEQATDMDKKTQEVEIKGPSLTQQFFGGTTALLSSAMVVIFLFVPYIGGLVNTVILALAAFLAFEDTGRALMVPIVFTVINILEGNLITPWILGRRMRLNTVAVFVGLVFWWYLWGITGAILAVPIMATIKITCDHIASLAPIGEFLAE
jgi:predicted PurR-regulated permease PerM